MGGGGIGIGDMRISSENSLGAPIALNTSMSAMRMSWIDVFGSTTGIPRAGWGAMAIMTAACSSFARRSRRGRDAIVGSHVKVTSSSLRISS